MNRSGIKSLIFFSAFAMLASTLSMQAQKENIAAEEAAEEVMAVIPPVAVEQGFSDLTREAQDLRLRNAQRELDRSWSSFIKCMTIGGKDCSAQARTVGVILKVILTAIATYAVVRKFRGVPPADKPKEEEGEGLQEIRPSTAAMEEKESPPTELETVVEEEK